MRSTMILTGDVKTGALRNVNSRFARDRAERIVGTCLDRKRLMTMPVHQFVVALVV